MQYSNEAKIDFDNICSISDEKRRYYSFLSTYKSVIDTVEARAKACSLTMEQKGQRNPIDIVKSRIKSTSGIREKLDEKNLSYTYENMSFIKDIAGIRIICPFIDDVYTVEEYFLSQQDMELVEKRDYIKNPKENGYKSLHLIMKINLYSPEGTKPVLFEIQIRTIAMELWGNIEHKLRYKKDLPKDVDEEILQRLVAYSKLMSTLDDDFKTLREMVEENTKDINTANPNKQINEKDTTMNKSELTDEKCLELLEPEVERQMEEQNLFCKDENGKFLLDNEGRKVPLLGACHIAWAIQKRLMMERFGREWETPAEKFPDIIFD